MPASVPASSLDDPPSVAALADLPQIRTGIETARQALAVLHRHPANRRGWPQTSAAAAVRAARASAALAGADVTVDGDAERITDPIFAGTLRVAAATGQLVGVWSRSPMQALAKLHTLLAADTVGDVQSLGRPVRNADRLVRLAGWVTSVDLPGPLLVAVVHAELLSANAFDDASGLVARAAARLAGIASGLDQKGLGVPEVAYLRAGDQYRHLAQGYQAGDGDAICEWVAASCGWLADGAREGAGIADAATGSGGGSAGR